MDESSWFDILNIQHYTFDVPHICTSQVLLDSTPVLRVGPLVSYDDYATIRRGQIEALYSAVEQLVRDGRLVDRDPQLGIVTDCV